MAKKRGLGRGLDALLGAATLPNDDSSDTEVVSELAKSKLSIEEIQRGQFQPRRQFDEDKLRELADSIAAQGIIQPIVVRQLSDGKYEIIAGERRWRAAQLAGLDSVPVVISEVDDQAAMAMSLIENIQRDDLNPLEEAGALHRLLDEFGLTHQQVAQAVGKSRTTVTNLMRLLDLNTDVKALLDQGAFEMGHARAMLALKDELQSHAAREVANKRLSVRETEALVKKLNRPLDDDEPMQSSEEENPDVRRLIESLGQTLGAKVAIKQSAGGKGRLEISYNTLDELEGILGHIK